MPLYGTGDHSGVLIFARNTNKHRLHASALTLPNLYIDFRFVQSTISKSDRRGIMEVGSNSVVEWASNILQGFLKWNITSLFLFVRGSYVALVVSGMLLIPTWLNKGLEPTLFVSATTR